MVAPRQTVSLKKRLLALGLGLVLIMLAEGGLRVVQFFSAGDAAGGRSKPNKFTLSFNRAPGYFEADETIFWRLKPHYRGIERGVRVSINALGFRDRDFSVAKPKGTMRVVCLGDSVTFGWDVPVRESYPKLLEALLKGACPATAIEVLNAGTPTHSSYQGRIRIQRGLLKLNPDLLIVGYGLNDEQLWHVTDRERKAGVTVEQAQTQPNLLQKSSLYLYGAKLLAQITGETRADQPCRVPAAEFRSNLEAIVREAQTNGAEVLLLGQIAVPGELIAYSKIIRDVADNTGSAYLDYRDAFVATAARLGVNLFVDYCHPTTEGNRLIAQEIFKWLEAHYLATWCHGKVEEEKPARPEPIRQRLQIQGKLNGTPYSPRNPAILSELPGSNN